MLSDFSYFPWHFSVFEFFCNEQLFCNKATVKTKEKEEIPGLGRKSECRCECVQLQVTAGLLGTDGLSVLGSLGLASGISLVSVTILSEM